MLPITHQLAALTHSALSKIAASQIITFQLSTRKPSAFNKMKSMNQLAKVILIGCTALLGSCSTKDTDIISPVDTITGGGNEVLGIGSDQDPYQLKSAEHIDVFLRSSLASSYILMNDIDLTNYISSTYLTEGWLPINGFSGVLNGNDFKISGLSINRPTLDNVGFFGTLGNGSNSPTVTVEIKNLTLEVAASESVTGNTRVGALIGYADDGLSLDNVHIVGANSDSQVLSSDETLSTDNGRSGGMIGLADRSTIFRCSSSIKVLTSGGGRIGGLIGMTNTTSVDQCYASGDVYAKFEDVGGLIGYGHNTGSTITNSYATGNIFINGAASDDIGGFIGSTHSSFTPENCYSTGNITIEGSTDTYGYFSGDGDGGIAIFASDQQLILNESQTDIASGAISEDSGFSLINIGSVTCATFSSFQSTIWSCTDGSFPSLINNP